MSMVLFETNPGSMSGLVVINADDISAIFQATGSSITSIVLRNGIGYQIDMSIDEVVERLDQFKHATAKAVVKHYRDNGLREALDKA